MLNRCRFVESTCGGDDQEFSFSWRVGAAPFDERWHSRVHRGLEWRIHAGNVTEQAQASAVNCVGQEGSSVRAVTSAFEMKSNHWMVQNCFFSCSQLFQFCAHKNEYNISTRHFAPVTRTTFTYKLHLDILKMYHCTCILNMNFLGKNGARIDR